MLFIYCFLFSMFIGWSFGCSFLYAWVFSIMLYYIICGLLSKCFSIEISTIDSAFLEDHPSMKNHPYLVGCSLLDAPLDSIVIANTIKSRFLISPYYKKLQKVLKTRFKVDFWTPYSNFQISDHIETIPEVKNRDELCELMSLHASEIEMDPAKPCWKIFIIEKFESNKSAIILKIDHCYGDGLSVMSFFLNVGNAENVRFVSLPKFNMLLFYLLFPIGIVKALVWAHKMVNNTKRDNNRFNELKITGKRQAYCSSSLDLRQCKEFSKLNGVSINELLLSLMIRTFQNYHHSTFQEPLQEFKVFIASSLRAVSNKLECIPLENNSNFVIMDEIPSSELSFPEFLKKVHIKAKFLLKSSLEFYYRGLASAFSYAVMPKEFNLKIVNKLTSNISCVFTNVPGPLEKIRFFGKTVEEMFFFTGGLNEAGLITTILSYGGKICFSCSADKAYRIEMKTLMREFEALYRKEIAKEG